MAEEISLHIGGRSYRMMVPEGQEVRLNHVASRVDDIVNDLRTKAPDMDRDNMVVLAAIQLADDLVSLEQERETEQTSLAAFHRTLAERLEKLIP